MSWPAATSSYPATRPPRYTGLRVVLASLILASAAVAVPNRAIRIPLPGTTVDLAVAVGVVGLLVIATRQAAWRLPPWPLVALGLTTGALCGASLAWTADRRQVLQFGLSITVGLMAAVLVVALLRGIASSVVAKLMAGWVLLWLLPCVLLWAYVPGFWPQVPSTDPWAAATITSYFARLSHPFAGLSNNVAALLVPLVVPLIVCAVRYRSKWVSVGLYACIAGIAATLSRGATVAAVLSVLLLVLVRRSSAKTYIMTVAGPTAVAVLMALFVIFVHPGLDQALEDSYGPAAAAHTFSDSPLRESATAGFAAPHLAPPTSVSTQQLITGRAGFSNAAGRMVLLKQGLALVDSPFGVGAGVGLHVHNSLVQQLIDFGYVGGTVLDIFAVLWVLWWFGRTRGAGGRAALAIGLGVGAQMVSFLVESSYEGDLLRRVIWSVWGLLCAWYLAARDEERQGALQIDAPVRFREGPSYQGREA